MADIDEDTLELLERRLGDRIEQNVRARLFKAYIAIGTAVAAVLAWVGFSLIEQAKDEAKNKIETTITNTQKDLDSFKSKMLSDYTSYFDDKKKEMDAFSNTIGVNLKVSQLISDQVNTKLAQIRERTEDTEPQLAELKQRSQKIQDDLAKLTESSGKIEDDLTKAREVGQAVRSDVARFQDLPEHLAQLTKDVQSLTLNVAKLASSAGNTAEQSDISHSAVQTADSVKTTLANIEADQSRPIVFLQYFGMPRATAEEIAARLRQQNLILPNIDNEAMNSAGLRAVRYYYDADANAAKAIAGLAEEALAAVNLPAGAVKVQNFTSYKGLKPKQGTLELWLGEPTVASN